MPTKEQSTHSNALATVDIATSNASAPESETAEAVTMRPPESRQAMAHFIGPVMTKAEHAESGEPGVVLGYS